MRRVILSALCLMSPLVLAPAPAAAQAYGYGQPMVDRLQELLVQVDQLNHRRRPDEFQASIDHAIEMVQNRFDDIRMGRMNRRQALELADEGLYNIQQYNYNGSDAAPPWLSYRTDEAVSEMRGLIANRRGGWRGAPPRGTGYVPIPILPRRPGWDAPPPPLPPGPPPVYGHGPRRPGWDRPGPQHPGRDYPPPPVRPGWDRSPPPAPPPARPGWDRSPPPAPPPARPGWDRSPPPSPPPVRPAPPAQPPVYTPPVRPAPAPQPGYAPSPPPPMRPAPPSRPAPPAPQPVAPSPPVAPPPAPSYR